MHPWRLKKDLYAVLKNKPHDFAPGGVFLRKKLPFRPHARRQFLPQLPSAD